MLIRLERAKAHVLGSVERKYRPSCGTASRSSRMDAREKYAAAAPAAAIAGRRGYSALAPCMRFSFSNCFVSSSVFAQRKYRCAPRLCESHL